MMKLNKNYVNGMELPTLIIIEVRETLKNNNKEYYNSEICYIKNDVSVYKKIKDLKEEDLIGYYKLLREEESGKVVQALGYNNWDSYLIKENCLDEKGKSDINKWFYNTYVELGKKMESKSK